MKCAGPILTTLICPVTYDPEKHHCRSIRARGYDYSSPGYYFINASTQHRECFYGEVVRDEMRLNDAGEMVERWWQKLAEKFVQVELDEHVTMPNHFHRIIVIVDHTRAAAMSMRSCDEFNAANLPGKLVTLGEIVQWFKTMTTNEFIRGVKESGRQQFDRKLWQRGYFEHVIRKQKSLNNIRRYIRANPLMWPHDRDNPQSIDPDKTERLNLANQLGVTKQEFESIVSFDDEYRSRSQA